MAEDRGGIARKHGGGIRAGRHRWRRRGAAVGPRTRRGDPPQAERAGARKPGQGERGGPAGREFIKSQREKLSSAFERVKRHSIRLAGRRSRRERLVEAVARGNRSVDPGHGDHPGGGHCLRCPGGEANRVDARAGRANLEPILEQARSSSRVTSSPPKRRGCRRWPRSRWSASTRCSAICRTRRPDRRRHSAGAGRAAREGAALVSALRSTFGALRGLRGNGRSRPPRGVEEDDACSSGKRAADRNRGRSVTTPSGPSSPMPSCSQLTTRAAHAMLQTVTRASARLATAALAATLALEPALREGRSAVEVRAAGPGAVEAISSKEAPGHRCARSGEEGRYVAAMHMAGVQIPVISAKYSAPALIREKLLSNKYQDIYVDLSSASERASRISSTICKGDGIFAPSRRIRPSTSTKPAGRRSSSTPTGGSRSSPGRVRQGARVRRRALRAPPRPPRRRSEEDEITPNSLGSRRLGPTVVPSRSPTGRRFGPGFREAGAQQIGFELLRRRVPAHVRGPLRRIDLRKSSKSAQPSSVSRLKLSM